MKNGEAYFVFRPIFTMLPVPPGDDLAYYKVQMVPIEKLNSSTSGRAFEEAKRKGHIAPIVGIHAVQ